MMILIMLSVKIMLILVATICANAIKSWLKDLMENSKITIPYCTFLEDLILKQCAKNVLEMVSQVNIPNAAGNIRIEKPLWLEEQRTKFAVRKLLHFLWRQGRSVMLCEEF